MNPSPSSLTTTEVEILDKVEDGLNHAAARRKASLASVFEDVVRRAIDEVVDGPRTGRWKIEQLEKTEATYLGTKVEILLRSALELDRGDSADLRVSGQEVDVKWSKTPYGWEIPTENVGQVCLGICLDKSLTSAAAFLFIPTDARLNQGANKDGKRTLQAAARVDCRTLLEWTTVPPNYIASLTDSERNIILSGKSAQERVRKLFSTRMGEFIPRLAVQTVAMKPDGDPLRRLRADKHNKDGLGAIVVLSTEAKKAEIRKRLGKPANEVLPANCFIAFKK